MINLLSDLNLSIPFKKVLSIKHDLVSHTKKEVKENNGVYIPTGLDPEIPLFFAIDNIDLTIDTYDGKNQLHGTTSVVFQRKGNGSCNQLNFKRNTEPNNDSIYDLTQIPEPLSTNDKYVAYKDDFGSQQVEEFRKWDKSWALSRVLDNEKKTQTWAATNSKCTETSSLSSYHYYYYYYYIYLVKKVSKYCSYKTDVDLL